MDINGVNSLSPNNTATTFCDSPNNTVQSDELAAPSSYEGEEKVTRYALKKRKIHRAKVAFFSITIGVTGGAVITSLVPVFKKAGSPQISTHEFEVRDNTLYYAIKVENIKDHKGAFTITNNEKEIYVVALSKDGSYVNCFELEDYGGSFSASVTYVDSNNNKQSLYTFDFTK